MNQFRRMGVIAGLWLCHAAAALTLPEGLQLDPPGALDLTYQVIPSYDEQDKVIARWSGDRLQYFIAVSRLPPGWTDAQTYHAGMARDLRAAWDALQTGRSERYRTAGGLSGSVVEYIRPSTDPDRAATTLLAHFLTDGKVSYLATVSVVPPAAVARVFDEALSLMRTATLGAEESPRVRSEDAFVGSWTMEERLPDGKTMTARIELKPDLTFATRARVGEQVILEASGTWARSGRELHWTYLYSKPELPARAREDRDTVVAADTQIVILRSARSNKERTMRRVPSSAR